MRLLRASLFLLLFPGVLAAQSRPVDWAAMQAEAVDVLRQYLRINTSNPPGNELEAARFLKAILEKEGIAAEVLDTAELGSGRANLYARLKGTPSHGSRPTKSNPVPRLVAALDGIARYDTPLHVTPAVQKFFHDISRNYSGQRAAWLGDVRVALKSPRARAWILEDVYWNAILRNTIALTGLQGSNKTNVIPAEASAEIDIRLLPDQDADSMLATLRRIAADTAVHFTRLIAPKAPFESPTNTDLFRAIERAAKERDPLAFVTSSMMTGATDRPTYRKLGIVTYGLDPFKVEAADSQRGVHGNDERLSAANVGAGVRYLYDILRFVQ